MVFEESVRAFSEFEHCEKYDDNLKDACLDGKDVKLEAPLDVSQDEGIGEEDKAVDENEAKVG